MHVPERFHRVHDWLCFFLGYLTNGALLWMIAFRTEADGRPYRPILLLATLTDLAYLAVYALVVPVLVIDRGIAVIISVGPLGWVPQPYNYALAGAWIFFFLFSLCSLCIPFLYRYAVICHKKDYGVRNFMAMLTIPFAFSLSYVGTCAYAGYPATEEDQQRGRRLFFNESITTRSQPYVMGYLAINEGRNMFISVYATILTTASYSLVFTCGWLIYRRLKHETTKNLTEERARVFSQQVSRTLLLQALVPLVVETVPTLVTCVGSLAGMQVSHLTVYVAAVLAWTPVVNPLIPMLVVGAYRREVNKWMAWLRCAEAPTSSTTVIVLSKTPRQLSNQIKTAALRSKSAIFQNL